MNFIHKKISTKQAMEILTLPGVQADSDEATVIFDFFHPISKNYNETREDEDARTLKENQTSEEMREK